MITFYEYPKCTTCRKGKKFLADNNLEFTEIDMVKHVPAKDTLKGILDKSSHSIDDFFNKRGTKFKELGLKERLHDLSEEEKLELLQGSAPAEINLYVKDMDGREPEQVRKEFAEKKLPGMSIGRYFEVSLTASKGGETQTISELPSALKVVIDVPEPLIEYILSCHGNQNRYIVDRYTKFRAFVAKKMSYKKLTITKDAGAFISKKW